MNKQPIEAKSSILDLRKQLLQRALAAAEKTKELSLDERVAIMKNLAECLRATNRNESSDLYKRAIALLPASSSESAEIARSVAQLYYTKLLTDLNY